MLGFNSTSTLVGHFVSSPKEREKRDSRDEREGQGRKRNRNKSEETEETRNEKRAITLIIIGQFYSKSNLTYIL